MTKLELLKWFCNWVKFRAVFQSSSWREICVSQASNDWDEFDFRSLQSMLKWQRFRKCWYKPSACGGIKGVGLSLTLYRDILKSIKIYRCTKLPPTQWKCLLQLNRCSCLVEEWKSHRLVGRDPTHCKMQQHFGKSTFLSLPVSSFPVFPMLSYRHRQTRKVTWSISLIKIQ